MISRKFLLVCMLSFNGVFASYYPSLNLDTKSPATVARYASPVVPSPTRLVSCPSPLMQETTAQSLPKAGISREFAIEYNVNDLLAIARQGSVREFAKGVVKTLDRTGVLGNAKSGCPIAQKAVLTIAQELRNQQVISLEKYGCLSYDALMKETLLKKACNVNINKHEKCFRVIPVGDI